MISERSIVALICLALSNIANCSSSLAGEPETSTFYIPQNRAITLGVMTLPISVESRIQSFEQPEINLKNNLNNHNSELILAQNKILQPHQEKLKSATKSQAETKEEILNSQVTVEEPQRISRRWSLIGMAITFLLSLIILWSLFQKEEQKQDREVDSESVSLQTQDKKSELFDEELIISEQLPRITVLNSEGEPISNQSGKSRQSIEAITIANANSFDGHQPKADKIQDLMSKNVQPLVEANLKDRGKIVTSNTTEIDVVFELIKDLQHSDLDLRRKAIWELAQTADSRALEPLMEIMSQVDALDKNLILDAIAQIALRNIQPINSALFTSLQDANSEVRKNAICDLVILYKPVSQITERLNQMLNDSDREVRQTAEWALKRFNQTSISSISQDFAKHS
ncbi:HEAT repeat domain-containing protein [Pleurocapsa sp. PCC 7319]|uniref:HEAT repeat domain-containing protein n=1 Tax=Pleurocapsa sp. PCC 7319 TaxID=118161 RepID=UPI00034AECDD|nr:hypothetical protein [Pleurocapsa sp. PCC 7319]